MASSKKLRRALRLAALGKVAVLAMPLGAGAAAAGAEGDAVLAEIGASAYQKRCASCHGLDGRGHGPVSDALRVPPPDLTRIASRRGGTVSWGEIARFIDGRFEITAHGTREMPVWGERLGADVPDSRLGEEITRGTIASLIEYLKTIQAEP